MTWEIVDERPKLSFQNIQHSIMCVSSTGFDPSSCHLQLKNTLYIYSTFRNNMTWEENLYEGYNHFTF